MIRMDPHHAQALVGPHFDKRNFKKNICYTMNTVVLAMVKLA